MSRFTSTTVGLLVGGAVGAAAALLFAPRRGEETRAEVMNWTRQKEHQAADRIRQTGSNLASGIRRVPAAVSEKSPAVMARMREMVGRGTERAGHAADQVEMKSEEMASDIDRMAGEMPQE